MSESYEVFRNIHLALPSPIPGYYRHMAPINRAGAKVFGEPPQPAELSLAQATELMATGTPVLDVRTRFDFAAGHVPGTLEFEESTSFLAYVGWLEPFNAPLALVSYDRTQAERITVDLFRIGYERVRGFLSAANARRAATAMMPTVPLEKAAEIMRRGELPVLDVRFAHEHQSEPLAGAVQRSIDTLPSWEAELPEGASLVVCGKGQRASMAGSILRAHGHDVVVLAEGGAAELRSLLAQPPV